jgi:serine/threonine-protein kinase ULK/ATG1
LITEDCKLKLADFGFSKQTDHSLMNTFCGTPITMAPEIFEKKTYRKENCDTWSLGIIVYQMLFG